MSKALTKTDFHFPGQKSVYHGKVRDVYNRKVFIMAKCVMCTTSTMKN